MYSPKYEEDKDYLVRKTVDSYGAFKKELDNLYERMVSVNYSPLTDISQTKLMSQDVSLSKHFEYVSEVNHAVALLNRAYRNLINNTHMLFHFIELTNEELNLDKKGFKILEPLYKNELLNASIPGMFLTINSIIMSIDHYVQDKSVLDIENLIYLKGETVYVDDNGIRQKEYDFREKITELILYELEQLKLIESQFDSNIDDIELYLKYYLFYK